MTKSSEESYSLPKKPTSKEDFFIWSYIVCLASIVLSVWLQTNELHFEWRIILGALLPATLVFLYWLFIRWVATTAEKAGRSFVSFMIFAIVAPLIAWLVVIMFKKPQTP